MNKKMITKKILRKKIIQVKLFNILMKILYIYIKSLGRKSFEEHNYNDFEIIYPGIPHKNIENFKIILLKKEV